ncbi:flavodoxin family protein [Nocardia vermiculata]|uniref:Flavodoxin n=1 Tax=Nocardia vermiculata TaxID=257274 RepID=A0A846Y285_9NOCA|nr:flavodoxin family protein [Nocardia vermiculata]NKY50719.1 flavodoxin [Nocardia vermiculata]
MKAIIVCVSVSHGNTRRIADTIGEVLDARVVEPEEVDPAELTGYDLVGFGSGIFNMNFHPRLRNLIRELPQQPSAPAFVFATSGFPEPPFRRYLRSLTTLLRRRGFDTIDTFHCRGFDTWLPLTVVGGIRKGRPDDADLQAALAFAERLQAAVNSTPR